MPKSTYVKKDSWPIEEGIVPTILSPFSCNIMTAYDAEQTTPRHVHTTEMSGGFTLLHVQFPG